MPIRVLHVVSALDGGGVAQMLMNYYKNLTPRDITFDFIVHGEKIGAHEKFLLDSGSQIFHAPPKRSKPLRNAACISRVIRRGNYDVVHAHQNMSSVIPLILAKHHQVPVRISHGHGYPTMFSPLALLAKTGIQAVATDYFACTNDVGEWLHPQLWNRRSDRSFVMRNALNLSRFRFNQAAREMWRERLGLGADPVLVQVGRLSPEKNHAFTLSLLERLRLDTSWKLIIVGDGPLEHTLRNQAHALNLTNDVIFLSYERDIAGLLSASDLAIMPSLKEGLGMAAIEAQASGLPVIVSDTLSGEVQVTDLIKFLPLKLSAWVKTVADTMLPGRSTVTFIDERLQAYAIAPAASKYLKYVQDALLRSKNAVK